MLKKLFNKNDSKKTKVIKNVAFWGSLSVLATGGIVLCTTQPWKDINDKDEDTKSMSSSDNLENSSYSSSNSEIIINSSGSETSENTSSDNSTTITIDDVTPAYINVTAEDVVKLSNSYSKYLNEKAKLSDKYYVFSEVKPEKLYSFIYLTNIDNINNEETEKLIENGLIRENIKENIADAFYISNLIRNDTANKMITAYNSGEKVDEDDFIDLSLILTDEDDIEAYNVMTKIMVEAVNNPETRKQNYKDLVYYYMSGEDNYDNSYDYSKSIFPTDKSVLTVGGDYLLKNIAYPIMAINKATKTDNARYNKILDDSLSNYANIMQIFDDKCLHEENSKQYTK